MGERKRGRITLPTDVNIIEDTIKVMNLLGADALRDADGTTFPQELADVDAKIYATYYTTRKDNDWAKANPDEIQQCYIMSGFYTATKSTLKIPLVKGISDELIEVNSNDNIQRWWEVINRTTGEIVPADNWEYIDSEKTVKITNASLFHSYTVSFLAYIIWDPVHMYNAVTNDWQDFEHQMTFDVRQPKTREFSMARLKKHLEDNPYIDVVRFTTFFHQFTLVFDELKRQKYVDWYGYSASVSPHILEQFEKEVGYPFRAEYIIDEGYYNNQYRVPSKEFKDFMAFQRREVALLSKCLVDITHDMGKEAMMFLGDHWVGTEPFMDEFKTIGLDAVVGSVGNGSTLRLISDIKGVGYTEGRLLPYFFPDTFYEGGDPTKEAKKNWVTARRALLRSPLDRIGYGGYLKLALEFPDFIEYIATVADEFRMLYDNINNSTPFAFKRVAVLNAWGKCRAWGCHMVHHALYEKYNYSYAGVIEILSGAPQDVTFISFDDIKENPSILKNIDVLVQVGDKGTAHIGEDIWRDSEIVASIRQFVHGGGGFVGIGEPSAYQWQGRHFQLSDIFGVEQENGLTIGYSKYNWQENNHFILGDISGSIDFGEGKNNIFAREDATVLKVANQSVQLATNTYGAGRAVYISGLPYSPQNSRLLHRAILWSANDEDRINMWFSTNVFVEVHAYPESGKYCILNNTFEKQSTTVYTSNGGEYNLTLEPNEIIWESI